MQTIFSVPITLHPSVSIVKIDAVWLGFLGIPGSIRIRDEDGVLYRLLGEETNSQAQTDLLASLKGDALDQVTKAVDLLRRNSLLIESTFSPTDRYFAQLDLVARKLKGHFETFDINTGVERAKKMKVIVVGSGSVANAFVASYIDYQLPLETYDSTDQIAYLDPDTSLLVGCYDAEEMPSMMELNSFARRNECALTFAVTLRWGVRVGPLLEPSYPGCLNCYQTRVHLNSEHPIEREQMAKSQLMHLKQPAGLLAKMVGPIAANQVVKFSMGLRHLVPAGQILEYNLLEDELEVSRLCRAPRCHVCGTHNALLPDSPVFRRAVL